MQDVQIHLIATHRVDGQTEETVHRYEGKGVEKGLGWYITYKEQVEGAGDVTTTVKVSEKEVTLLRQGTIQMKQQFQKGVSHHSPYVSPHGRFSMETHTHKLRITSEAERPQEIRIAYQLWLNQQYAGEHELMVRLTWH
jgi:uncharacterized beta-barrel protein YwiB (DUF1934 family)